MSEDVVIVDLGIGNFANVEKALDGMVTNDAYDIEKAEKIVLPGVGNFGSIMEELQPLKGAIIDSIEEGKPFLGICLGMHLIFERSEENDGEGLGILKGEVVKFKDVPPPHIGWNQIHFNKKCRLQEGVKEDEFFYFVHSYIVDGLDEYLVSAVTDYQVSGEITTFPSIISKRNIFGVQFHPEKSSKAGLKMLKNFKQIDRCLK